MPLILAIEPDKRQAAHLSALRKSLDAELVISDTAERAIDALGERVPDLVLTSALLSPKDECALVHRLRALNGAAAHVQTLTIPVLAAPARRSTKAAGMFARLKRLGPAPAAPDGCDPTVFAGQVTAYLEHATAERERVAASAAVLEAPATLEIAAEPQTPVSPGIKAADWFEPHTALEVAASEPIVALEPTAELEPGIPVEPAAGLELVGRSEPAAVLETVVELEAEVVADDPMATIEQIERVSVLEPSAPTDQLEVESLGALEPIATVEPDVAPEPVAALEVAFSETVAELEPTEAVTVLASLTALEPDMALELAAALDAAETIEPSAPVVMRHLQREQDSRTMPCSEPQLIVAGEATLELEAIVDVDSTVEMEPVVELEPIIELERESETVAPDRPEPPEAGEPIVLNVDELDLNAFLAELAAATADNSDSPADIAARESTVPDGPATRSTSDSTATDELWMALPERHLSWPPIDGLQAEETLRCHIESCEPAPVETAAPPTSAVLERAQLDEVDIDATRGRHAPPPSRKREQPGAARRPVPPGQRPPNGRRRRKGTAAPVQDEWGFFDPEQCGFAALVAKLDEVVDAEDVALAKQPA